MPVTVDMIPVMSFDDFICAVRSCDWDIADFTSVSDVAPFTRAIFTRMQAETSRMTPDEFTRWVIGDG